jgi:hypothetical protein
MISADSAISHFRRGLTLGSVLKGLLLAGAVACLLLRPVLAGRVDTALLLAGIGGVWIALSYRSLKGSRVAADSPSLIASGQFEQAEAKLDEALRSFSLFRTVKLLSLHHLAVLRHAQRRWGDTASLCRALLRQRLGAMQGLSKPTQLMLADALLELGDLRGAQQAIGALERHQLSLNEAMTFLLIQLDYQHRMGAWEPMLSGLEAKVQLAELMPSTGAARAQAMLALAAKKRGRTEWMRWLRDRAGLLAEVEQLCSARPALRELWEEQGVGSGAVGA